MAGLTGCFEIVSAPMFVVCSRILSSPLSMTPSLQRKGEHLQLDFISDCTLFRDAVEARLTR